MTLPGSQDPRHWQGRVLVDRNGEAVGNIETVYLDKATGQPEWARLEAGTARPAPTIVPLAGASEEDNTIRVPFAKTLVEQAPSMPAGRELSEDQEEELYRHYGIPYSRAESPSGLPAGGPLPAGEPQRAGIPPDTSEPQPAVGEPLPASEPMPTDVGGPPPETAVVSEVLVVRERVRITDPRVGAAAGVALAVAAGAWRRQWVGRQIKTAISRLGAIQRTSSRRRRQRRRAETVNQAVTSAMERTAALAWGTVRTLAAAVLVSVAGAVQGGRRTRAGAQAAQAAIVQRGRRLRPRPRRKQRRGTLATVVGGAAAISRLGAIPTRVSRRLPGKTINRAVTSASKQTTVLARTTARLLAGAALLPATGVVQGGRRARAGVQAAQQAVRQGGRRLRPRPRRRRRRGTLGMLLGGTAGYVLGARAGEQGYQKITQTAERLTERPEFKRVSERAAAKLDQLSGQAADKLQKARQSTPSEASSRGDQSITAAPDTPPE